ncbi:MAG: transposase [Sulfitobacter sp.]
MRTNLRHRALGATYFFTVRLAQRADDLLLHHVDALRDAMRQTKARFPFHIDAITVLPRTLHMLWTLPEGDSAYPARIAMLKSRFSRAMPLPEGRSLSQIKRGEKGIWQTRYWEHQIRDGGDFARHRDLIYLSPVHAGLCARPQDWAHTSLHRDLAQGGKAPAAIDQGAGDLRLTGHPRQISKGSQIVVPQAP